jgi:hypothetical protein
MTKRHLAWFFLIGGLMGVATILAVDWIGAGQFDGIGPVQQLALGAAGLVSLLGLSLFPFGHRPA